MSAAPRSFRRLIGHVDGDAFYVNAERIRQPFLRDKPVGVISNQGYFVIAKSNEMKRLGITTGEPLPDALQKCPEGIYVKRDFRWYEVVSRKMLDCLRQLSPCVEYYSIDELFFVVPEGAQPQSFAEEVRARLWADVHLPATVGIARSRTLAKLLGDTIKPFGAKALLSLEEERTILATRAITDITGISHRRARRLESYGLKTCLDLAQAPPRLIRGLLTVVGLRLWHELNGEAVEPVRPQRPRHKILSRGGSIGQASTRVGRVWAFVVRNLERFVEELEFYAVRPGRVDLVLRFQDDQAASAGCRLETPTARFDLLLDYFRVCFVRCWQPGRPVNGMHLIGTDLHQPGSYPRGLFDPPDEPARTVSLVKRQINERLGRFLLRSGATLPLDDVYRDDALNYDACDIRGKFCF